VSEIFAFNVSVKGTDWTKVVNAHTRGKAKREMWLSVTDCYPDVPFTAMRARKRGVPVTTDDFRRTANYRGRPAVRCGDRVTCRGGGRGVVVGSNSSANFDVLFDLDSPLYAGQRLNCHPYDLTFATPEAEP
jgi:hypothetical protein